MRSCGRAGGRAGTVCSWRGSDRCEERGRSAASARVNFPSSSAGCLRGGAHQPPASGSGSDAGAGACPGEATPALDSASSRSTRCGASMVSPARRRYPISARTAAIDGPGYAVKSAPGVRREIRRERFRTCESGWSRLVTPQARATRPRCDVQTPQPAYRNGVPSPPARSPLRSSAPPPTFASSVGEPPSSPTAFPHDPGSFPSEPRALRAALMGISPQPPAALQPSWTSVSVGINRGVTRAS